MSNLSYCRFENTLKDLRDCHEHIRDILESETENKARLDLIALCQEIIEEVDEVPEQDALETEDWGELWCRCNDGEPDFDNVYYVPDYKDPRCTKHHYRCEKCDKLVQIG